MVAAVSWSKRRKKIGTLVMGILITAFVLLIMSPVYVIMLNGFKTYEQVTIDPFGWPNPVAWENFSFMWKQMDFLNSFLKTLVITVFGVSGILLFSSMAAYRITRYPGKVTNAIYYFFIAGMIVPFQTLMIPLVLTSSAIGIISTLWGIVLIYWGLGAPQAIFLVSGFVKGVPKELEESASIDGCGQLRLFFAIVLPLLKPIMMTLAILDVLWLWNDYLLPVIYLTDFSLKTLMLSYKYVLSVGVWATRWDHAMAAMMMTILPITVFYLCLQKHIMSGLTSGALKG